MCESQKERITDTLTWVPQHIPVPSVSNTELIVAGLNDVTTALQSPSINTSIMELTEQKRSKLIAISTALRQLTHLRKQITPFRGSHFTQIYPPITHTILLSTIPGTVVQSARPPKKNIPSNSTNSRTSGSLDHPAIRHTWYAIRQNSPYLGTPSIQTPIYLPNIWN
jgi:hypothetical protein